MGIRTLSLQFYANTVSELQFNQFDPHSPPATVLINNPGDYWIFLSNIKQWIPPNTPNASYRWNGDMYAEVHTDLTPTNQFGFVPGTNQSTQACTITWTNDPTINPTGAANQFKVVQYPPTLIGKFVTVANGTNQHFPTQVNNGVPGVDTYLLPAGTQSVIIVWSGDAPAQSLAPEVPLVLIVGNSDGSIFWGGFNITPGVTGTGGSFSDSVFICTVATAVDNGIRILLNESSQAQTYYVLASPVPVAEAVTVSGTDVTIPVSPLGPASMDSFGPDQTITSGAVVGILAANTARTGFILTNTGSGYVRWVFGALNNPTATSGIRLAPGQTVTASMPFLPTDQINMIAESTTTTISITEFN